MYEAITYESILQRMLAEVPTSIDKREGSIIYDALAPCALELQLMYIELDVILKETFADTASREYLIRRATERGLSPTPATHAVLRGVFNMEIPIGARFSQGELNYIVTECIGEFEYLLWCESAGVIGNRNFGNLIPIGYIDGLTKAELVELIIPGEDEEDTESFRERYFTSFTSNTFGGNVADYLEKTNNIDGVGATKVTPIWNGGGTVKLTILGSDFGIASDILIDNVQQIIDPTKDGYGVGLAPIGHVVTVETATEQAIDISMHILFDTGHSFSNMKTSIEKVILEYLLELRTQWAVQDSLVVRIAQMEALVMGISGVLDISQTKLNGGDENIIISGGVVPILGVLTSD
ncbi:MAG: baseplate J/gp47 family protein [Bacillota bacterium]